MGSRARKPKTIDAPVQPVSTAIRAFKGFDKDLKCRGFQYEVGKSYTHDGDVSLCYSGFHACLNPLDVWTYYAYTNGNRYAEVLIDGVEPATKDDSKQVAKTITIVREMTLTELVLAECEFVNAADGAEFASGDSSKAASSGNASKAASSGDSSTAASSGDASKAASSGNYSTAASSGDYSKAECDTNGFAAVAGIGGYAKGNAGSAIAIGYRDDNNQNRFATGVIGENGLEAGVLYRAKITGKIVKA